MSSHGYSLIRTAQRDWVCAKCSARIPAGTKYRDTAYYEQGKWEHIRKHRICPTEEYPLPIVLKDGTKEWLLGKVHNMQGEPVFLTRDWASPHKYHFRVHVYNEEMIAYDNQQD